MLIAAFSLFACTANFWLPEEYHKTEKLRLIKHTVTRQDTLYFISSFAVIKKKHFKLYERGAEIEKDTTDGQSRTLSKDADTMARTVFSKKNPVRSISLSETQRWKMLSNYLTMIDRYVP